MGSSLTLLWAREAVEEHLHRERHVCADREKVMKKVGKGHYLSIIPPGQEGTEWGCLIPEIQGHFKAPCNGCWTEFKEGILPNREPRREHGPWSKADLAAENLVT